MANLYQPSLIRVVDSNGNPVPGARLSFYLTETLTPATWYTDHAGLIAGTNPLVADSAGKFANPAYLDPETTYRIICTDVAQSETIYEVDPVRGYDEGMIQTAADAAVEASDSAVASASAASASETAAAASQVTASGAATTAASDAAQAGVYLAGFNASGTFYASEAAGRAAVADGVAFWVGTTGNIFLYRRVNSGSSTLLFTPAAVGGLMAVPSTVGGSGNAITLSPLTGFSVVSSGAGQQFTGVAAATNSAAGPTVAITGVFSSAATQVVLANGEPVPANTLQANYPFTVEPMAALGKYVLRYPSGTRPSVLYATQTSGTGNAIVATLNHPGSVLRSDLTGAIINVSVTAAKAVGAASLSLKQSDGTVLLADTVLLTADDATAPATGAWVAGDVIEIQRYNSHWNLIRRPDPVTPNVMRAAHHLIETGYPVSADRPMSMVKTRPDTWVIDVRPHSSHYRDGYRRTQTDRVRFFVKDMRYYTTLTAPCLVPVGFVARMGGDSVQFSNFSYDEIVGSIIGDTGLTPSAFHPVVKIGRYGVDDPSAYALAGPLHGNYAAVTGTVIGTTNDASTSNVDATSSDMADAAVGAVFSGDKVVITNVMSLLTPDGHIAARMTLTITFESAANYQMLIAATIDFGHASVNTTPGWRDGSYAPMLPSRDIQAAAGVVSGTPGSTVLLGYEDASTKLFGYPDKLVGWHERSPTVKAEQIHLFGVPYKQDGVAVPFGDQVFALDNNYGPKIYPPIGPAIAADMASKVLTFSTGYRAVYADNLV